MNIVNTKIYYGIFAIASLVLDLSTSWSASLRDRQQLTQEPVEGARKEDEVVVWGAGALGSEGPSIRKRSRRGSGSSSVSITTWQGTLEKKSAVPL
jgi:hypothetical protein